MKKVVFFGTPRFPIAPLKALVESKLVQIEAVVTNPDKLKGRGRRMKPPPLKVEALKHGLTVLQPHSLRTDEKFLQQVKDIGADLFILSAYAKIVPEEYISVPPLGTINIHPSLLPKYRGPSPIQEAILAGEKKTGITLIVMDEQFDHGPMLIQKELEIGPRETYNELHDKLAELAAKMLIDILPDYIEGKLKPTEQDHSKASYTKIFTRKDGEIDWKEPAELIDRQIRAIGHEPGTHTFYEGRRIKMIKIHKAEPDARDFKKEPGTVVSDNREFYVQTGEGSLKLLEIQMEGKGKVTPQEFANGHSDFDGTVFQAYR
jgi:methionyl-tRNA formyltransferase